MAWRGARAGRSAGLSRVLYLSQLLPYPPDAGPKVRSYYVLRHLARQHQVTLLAFTRPDDKAKAVEHLLNFCMAVYTVPMGRSPVRDVGSMANSLLTGLPFIIQRDFIPDMAERVD